MHEHIRIVLVRAVALGQGLIFSCKELADLHVVFLLHFHHARVLLGKVDVLSLKSTVALIVLVSEHGVSGPNLI